jgi:hypothetical protein
MNLFFGASGRAADEQAGARLTRYIDRHHHCTPSYDATPPHVLLGHTKTDGKLLGRARRDGHVLLFMDPFPGAAAGSVLEQPDHAASLLLDRFLRCGPAFLDGLCGYYALVVVDATSGAIHLASDPYGQRSIFVHRDADSLVFASNVGSAVAMLNGAAIDRRWEDFFLMYGFYPYGHTPFAGLTAAPPGELLTWNTGNMASRSIRPYEADAPPELPPGAAVETAIEYLYDGFMQTLEKQSGLSADAGVLLGGFDSALVAAGLSRLGKRVTTWSFRYDRDEYNQPHTGDLASFLDIRHHWVPIGQEDIERGIEQLPYVFNQPTNWPNYIIQTAMVCQKMREAGIPLAYSGDGCDTVFLGYPGTWRRARVLERVPSLPDAVASRLAGMLGRPRVEQALGHPYRVMLNLIRTASWPPHARGFLSFRILDEVSLEQLRAGEPPARAEPARTTVEALASRHRNLPVLRLAYMGKSLVSPNRNKMNGSSDQSGIPILSPYMHPTFKRLAQSLPEELCRPTKSTASRVTGKFVLMQMAERKNLLPSSVIYQRKVAAVDAPIDAWYAGPMRGFLMQQFESLPFRANMDYLWALLEPRTAETLFQKYLLTDKVIKHAPSLLATYARFCALPSEITKG